MKIFTSIFLALVLSSIPFTLLAQRSQVRLTMKDNLGIPITITCGLDVNATDSLDEGIGENVIPNFHPPCSNNFHAAFREPDGSPGVWGSFWTYSDFRPFTYNPNKENIYSITLCASDRPYVDFLWEIDGKDRFESAQLADRFGNVVLADMMKESSVRSTLFTENYRVVLKNKPIVSVSETKENISNDIYPNPASNMLFVRHIQNVKSVDIQTILGTTIVSIVPSVSDNISTINITALPSGTYFVRIVNSSDDVVSKVFIKQ